MWSVNSKTNTRVQIEKSNIYAAGGTAQRRGNQMGTRREAGPVCMIDVVNVLLTSSPKLKSITNSTKFKLAGIIWYSE